MYRNYNFDAKMEFHDGLAAITASGAGVVAGGVGTRDVGTSRFEAVAVVNVTAIDTANADETYQLAVRGSNSSDMTSQVNLAMIDVAKAGRIELPFVNVKSGDAYKYIDVYVTVAGTTPSITFTAFGDRVKSWG